MSGLSGASALTATHQGFYSEHRRRRALAVVATSAFDGSVALGLFAAAESLLNPGSDCWPPVPLGALLGAALGACLGSGHVALLRFSRAVQVAAWTAAGGAAGLLPAIAVGAIAKLHGPHRTMALATLVGSCALGAAAGALVSSSQPDGSGARRATRVPWLAASFAAAALGLVATEVCDYSLLVLRSYPPLVTAVLASGCVFTVHTGIAAGARWRARRRGGKARTVGVAAWTAIVALGAVFDARMSDEQISPLLFRPVASRFVVLARTLTDFDRDGSSSLFGGGDCAPFDAKVNPRARELPGNGIDDNCRFGDARARRTVTLPAKVDAPPPAVNVLLVTIDTLRADHVGAYGYPRPTTPHIDAFGKGALRFQIAYTSGGWTCLALQSMLTGLYPRELDWKPVALTTEDRMVPFPWEAHLSAGEHWMNTLSAPVHTPVAPMPLWLAARGVRTAAVVAELPGAILSYGHFLETTFERAFVAPRPDDALVVDRALQVLSSFGDAPFFLWVHLFEPHTPYDRHAEVPYFGDDLIDGYDHDVAFADYQVGRLLDAVDSRRGRGTAVIIAADHGESFAGGVPTHGTDLHEESIRIPLLVRGPGTIPGVCDTPVSLVDVAPTILEWTGTRGGDLDGKSLLHPVRDRVLITDIWRHDKDGLLFLDLVGATKGDERLVRDLLYETSAMYRARDMSRPLRPLDTPIDENLRNAIGRYLDGAGVLE